MTALRYKLNRMPFERRLYTLEGLPSHLSEADKKKDLCRLLIDFDWIQAKLTAVNVNALIMDCNLISNDKALRELQEAILLSAHVLAKDKTQLAGQLVGRLLSGKSTKIQNMLSHIEYSHIKPWLQPLRASLVSPGGSLITTLAGNSDWIYAVAITSDSKYAVSAATDHTLIVWDLQRHVSVRTLNGHKHVVTAVATLPNGHFAVSGSYDGTLRVWDLDTGANILTMKCDSPYIEAVAVTADGRFVVSGAGGIDRNTNFQTLECFDLRTGSKVHSFGKYRRKVYALSLIPGTRFIFSAGWDLRIWDCQTGSCVGAFDGGKHVHNTVAVTPDGSSFVYGSLFDNSVKLCDLQTGQLVRIFKTKAGNCESVCVAPNGNYLVSGWQDGTIRIWKLTNKSRMRVYRGHMGEVQALSVTPDARCFVSGSEDKTLRMWRLGIQQSKHGYKVSIAPTGTMYMSISPTGQAISGGSGVVYRYDNALEIWDIESGRRIHALRGVDAELTGVAFTPDGHSAISVSSDDVLRVWSVKNGKLIRKCQIGDKDDYFADEHFARCIAVTPDSQYAVCGYGSGDMKVWNLKNGKETLCVKGPLNGISTISVSSDGYFAVSGSGVFLNAIKDYTVKIWDLRAGKKVHEFKGHKDNVHAVAVSPSSYLVISGAADKTIRIWDLRTRKCVHTLVEHEGAVNTVAVSPDNHFIVSGCASGTLRVWAVSSGKCISSFSCEGSISTCAILRDKSTIVVGETSGRFHLLRLKGV